MKNNPCYLAFATFIFWVGTSFTQRKMNGQTTDSASFGQYSSLQHDVQAVSSTISVLYGADYSTVESYVQAAVSHEAQIGIPATVVVSIAVYESSFKSELFQESGNPFGIKAGKDWGGLVVYHYDDGMYTPFRKYGSAEEAVLDFGRFIQARRWYDDARGCSRYDYVCVVDGLKKTAHEPGYSTNSEWDEKVVELIERLGLEVLSER